MRERPRIRARSCAAAVLSAATLFVADDARAAGASWLLDVHGEACEADKRVFEREVALACNAMGTCTVAASEAEAELRATLLCGAPDRPWWLETRTVEGALLSTVELASSPHDRLREAAVEIARDAAPERTLAAETLRNTLAGGDRVAAPVRRLPRLSMTMSAHGKAGPVETEAGGVRALLAIPLLASLHGTFGATGYLGGSSTQAFRHARFGPGLAVGAPFTRDVLGASLEAGLAVTQAYRDLGGMGRIIEARTYGAAFAQASIFLQAPLGDIRPFTALSFAIASESPYAMLGVDLGLAFPVL